MDLRRSILLALARRYIAGEDVSGLVSLAKRLNSQGFRITANYLGEDVATDEQVRRNVDEYILLMEAFEKGKLASSISIKPTQVGLSLSREIASKNVNRILEQAADLDQFVWIDMESSPYTDDILRIYLSHKQSYSNIGITLQAYLKRSQGDLKRMLENESKIRVVKGAYNETPDIMLKGKSEIRNNLAEMLKALFKQNNFFSIGTHDNKLIELATALSHEFSNDNFEFQFLKGIREEKASELLDRRFKVSIYTPYGRSWMPYSIRRMRERDSATYFVLRSILRL
ncbi:MAG: proline dehydrogenase family protein [Nitrososphaerota archaeon]|jgi:proline dehydrogenase|nr:proline dehydrogenase family protein [Nitrososphaerota archaeon]